MKLRRISVLVLITTFLAISLSSAKAADYGIENCKLVSQNGFYGVNLGWLKNSLWLDGIGRKKFLVVGIDFSNARESGPVSQMVAGFELEKVNAFYSKASYGKMGLDFTIANAVVSLPISDVGVYDIQIAGEVAKQIPRSYKLADFDGLIGIVTSNSSYTARTALMALPPSVMGNETGHISNATIVAGISPKVPGWTSWMVIAHEIGHLLGLMDLWSREDALAWEGKTSAPFSLMNTGAGWTYAPDFFAWEKWRSGWIADSEVVCLELNNVSAQIDLVALASPMGKKLVVLPISTTKVIAIEFRQRSELDVGLQKSGVLVYEIDLTKGQFQVPIKLIVSQQAAREPSFKGLEDWKRNKEAPLGSYETVDAGFFRVSNLADLATTNLLITSESLAEVSQRVDALKMAKPTPRKMLSITCTKGKITKKVTAVNPKCPSGYKKVATR
jgi:hypothetical protein